MVVEAVVLFGIVMVGCLDGSGDSNDNCYLFHVVG